MSLAKKLIGSLMILVLNGIVISSNLEVQAATVRQQKIVDSVASLTVQKFSNTSCNELSTLRQNSNSSSNGNFHKKVIVGEFLNVLKENPDLKTQFFNQISIPILTKMFNCGLIPPK